MIKLTFTSEFLFVSAIIIFCIIYQIFFGNFFFLCPIFHCPKRRRFFFFSIKWSARFDKDGKKIFLISQQWFFSRFSTLDPFYSILFHFDVIQPFKFISKFKHTNHPWKNPLYLLCTCFTSVLYFQAMICGLEFQQKNLSNFG